MDKRPFTRRCILYSGQNVVAPINLMLLLMIFWSGKASARLVHFNSKAKVTIDFFRQFL